MFKEYPTICIVDDEPSVCKALRRLIISAGFNVITYGSGRAIPILFISANGTAKTKCTGMAAGAVAFFQKPVDEKDLLTAIHKSIGPFQKRTRM